MLQSMQDLWILEQLIVVVGGSSRSELMRKICWYLFSFFQTLLKDEENQIRGFTYVFDCSGLTLSHLSIWTPQECSRVLSICEKNLPMRHKDINLLNLPFPMWAVFEFCKTLLSDKIRKRFSVLSSIDKLVTKMGTGTFKNSIQNTPPYLQKFCQQNMEEANLWRRWQVCGLKLLQNTEICFWVRKYLFQWKYEFKFWFQSWILWLSVKLLLLRKPKKRKIHSGTFLMGMAPRQPLQSLSRIFC